MKEGSEAKVVMRKGGVEGDGEWWGRGTVRDSSK
jgi:hypothetical protein